MGRERGTSRAENSGQSRRGGRGMRDAGFHKRARRGAVIQLRVDSRGDSRRGGLTVLLRAVTRGACGGGGSRRNIMILHAAVVAPLRLPTRAALVHGGATGLGSGHGLTPRSCGYRGHWRWPRCSCLCSIYFGGSTPHSRWGRHTPRHSARSGDGRGCRYCAYRARSRRS